jgi:citrate synthase
VYDAKGLHPNLDYPAESTYHLIGFVPHLHPIFVAARLPGWTAHITEQLAAYSLIRPRCLQSPTVATEGQKLSHLMEVS